MPIGAFTGQFDVALLCVQVFFVFFLCLVYYLRQEDKREGYPLVSERTRKTGGRVVVEGFPPVPKPKVFIQPHGRPPVFAPRVEEAQPIHAMRLGNQLGLPIEPIGDPMLAGVGPGSWLPKADEPDLSFNGEPVFRPMRTEPEFHVHKKDPDPRGWAIVGLDKERAGRVVDIWIDKSEHFARFLEVELDPAIHALRIVEEPATPDEEHLFDKVDDATAETRDRLSREITEAPPPHRVLIPTEFISTNPARRLVRTDAVTAAQFANAPGRKADTLLTAREEQRIRGYFGGGFLYASPRRRGPLL